MVASHLSVHLTNENSLATGFSWVDAVVKLSL
ncbi:Protein of unknown function [Lactobacillus helveticus CIRM-BIA 101]|uniref:Uncharacterized protein n=3 Tax=Lactobacillus helveticus TaxID=1587 RepID=U4QFZ2_LACHE|nr:Protein of unknown function [Lactobacillus helveticus CIRM-BIA 953]CDI59023.1 Protein of unknown function [Lactobacillus helveticus CIRM-BIA 951]CDI60110.1 Protein of unknown function [Lactobacillus helveticus CIRM-BIA 104]CDI64265.1 Protein of unknown function [Lactobacillus helveticus CIRM-BIA 101]CDI43487.1 Protein of unknown function [Lactobacillus helveticus CIRM-BIA 953]